MNDETTVILVIGATVGMVYVARLRSQPSDFLRKPGSMIRIGFGGVLLIVVTLGIAKVDGGLAKAIAWLIFLGSASVYGGATANAINTALNNPRPPLPKKDAAARIAAAKPQ